MSIEQRFERMERQIKRLRLTVFGLVAVLLAVPLVGAVMPQEIPDVIEARKFRVIDENGKVRAGMLAGGIIYADENGTTRAGMGAEGFIYFDENGAARASMDADGIVYSDENETIRAWIGLVPIDTPASGVSTTYSAVVALSDAEGNVIWQAPR